MCLSGGDCADFIWSMTMRPVEAITILNHIKYSIVVWNKKK